ncbi:SCO4848 family membrane protein [Streptomyces sp. NPDC052396]|uniref:SCO4848 family membrane protein n=1 Tax=Streptomyces sp. NPDC052396 TaxID=3365689 RepID=UPI0037D172EB
MVGRPVGPAVGAPREVGTCIWITFAKNLWQDGSGLAFDHAGNPTAYFWVHLALAITSFLLGTAVGVIGLRGVRALRRTS